MAFKENHNLNGMFHELCSTINRTFPAPYLHISPTTPRIVLNESKPSPTSLSASNLVYQFAFICLDTWIDRTDQGFLQRISEHIHNWLTKSMTKSIVDGYLGLHSGLSILKHLITNTCTPDPISCFKLLLHNTPWGFLLIDSIHKSH